MSSLDIIRRNLEYWHTTDAPSFSEEYIILIYTSHSMTIWRINYRTPTDIEPSTRACESEYLEVR